METNKERRETPGAKRETTKERRDTTEEERETTAVGKGKVKEDEKGIGKSFNDDFEKIQENLSSREGTKLIQSASTKEPVKKDPATSGSIGNIVKTTREGKKTILGGDEKTKSSYKRTREGEERPTISRRGIIKAQQTKKSKQKIKDVKRRLIKTNEEANALEEGARNLKRPKESRETTEAGDSPFTKIRKVLSDRETQTAKRPKMVKKRAKKSRDRSKQSEAKPTSAIMLPEDNKPAQKGNNPSTAAVVDNASDYLSGPYEEDVVYGLEANLQEHHDDCLKNPRHEQFIPITSFEPQHLPTHYRKKSMFELVKTLADLTVRLTVTKVSNNRPKTFNKTPYPRYENRGQKGVPSYGTGRVVQVKKYTMTDCQPCPCSSCKKSSAVQEWAQIRVVTATHVVFDDEEARHTLVRWGYDSDTSQEVLFRGTTAEADIEGDVCHFFSAIHDIDFADKLSAAVDNYKRLSQKVFKKYESTTKDEKLAIIVSHPHGCPKHVSVGQWTKRTDIQKNKWITVYVDTDQEESGDSNDTYYDDYYSYDDNYTDVDKYDDDDSSGDYNAINNNYVTINHNGVADFRQDDNNDLDDNNDWEDDNDWEANNDWEDNNDSEDKNDSDDNNDWEVNNDSDDNNDWEYYNDWEDNNDCDSDNDCDNYCDSDNDCSDEIDQDGDDNDYDDYDPNDYDDDYTNLEDKYCQRLANSHTCSKYSYTASTCPGTSGATVFLLGRDDWTSDHLHSLGTAEGNCSGYAFKNDL